MKHSGTVAGVALALLPCMGLAGTPDPNHPLPDGSSMLAWAVENQDHERVRLLLKRGAKPDGVGDPSSSPLIVACQYGDPVILNMLLNAHAGVKIVGAGGITPLALCAGSAPAAIVTRMIAAGAEVEKADDKGQTPLMWAAAKGRVESIRLLMEHGALINRATSGGFTPLFFALKSGVPAAPDAVLEAGGDASYVAPDGTSVVQLAMYQKNYEFAARMIERGASVTAFDRNGDQLLHAAVLANQPSLVKLLLAKGADVNAPTGESKVKWRCEVNFMSAPYEPPPKSPLLLAAESGSAEIMRMLVDAGADPKFRAKDGTNVVLAAASSGNVAALQQALELEPDVNVTTSDGQTPLHILLGSNTSSDTGAMMKLLAAKGARTDLKNKAGETPADVAKEAQTEAKAAFESTFAPRTARNL